MTILSDIVLPPPTPPPHVLLPIHASGHTLPYVVLAVVACTALWLLRKRRPS